jgi:hypothetical protein
VMCRVRDNPGLRQSLVERGRLRAQAFSPELMARAHLRAFSEAVAAYSPVRYRWQALAYQPYHSYTVRAKHAARQFLEARRATGCRITFSRGWHAREAEGSNWLRWSDGAGRMTIYSPGPMSLRICGECASLARPNEVHITANGAVVSRWTIEGEFGFHSLPELAVKLHAGKNVLEFVSSRPPARPRPNDPRMVAIAFRNLEFSDESGKEVCRICD